MSDTPSGRNEYRLAIIGAGTAYDALAGLLSRPDFRASFPWVRVVGVAEIDPAVQAQDKARVLGVPVYSHYRDLFQAHPDVDMVLDLTGNDTLKAELRATAPVCASVVDRASALVLWELIASKDLYRSLRNDLVHAMALFRTIVNEMEEDVLLLDLQGNVADANRSALERRGATKEELVGRHFSTLDPGRLTCAEDNAPCPLDQTLETGQKAEALRTRVAEDGRMHYYRVYTYPVYDENRRLTNVLEIRRDITNRRNMEIKLQQSQKMAAVGELSTYIAHEIRNPLFAIGGFANALLRAPSLDESAREKASIILEESKRLDKILKSILNFARPTEAREGKVDIFRVVMETAELFGLGCERYGIRIALDVDKDLALAQGDPDLLKQCLVNLVKNAQEAMTEGGDLTLRARMNGDRIIVEVSDTGTGIPPEIREKIFNPFFSTKDKGAGLGLAMTKKIVEDMGGTVDLASQQGLGTTVSLRLLPVLAVDGEA
ncbi:MAG: PAS domain-containing protein [Desulfovibrionaceae bacterium]|jgi:PAS domain S-box-containing protein|nr:PAS domain-containing protein [Desulfovibrionaceae bacterium]